MIEIVITIIEITLNTKRPNYCLFEAVYFTTNILCIQSGYQKYKIS